MQDSVTRRQYLLAGGAATATALGGIAATTSETSAATAQVSGSFSVPDAKGVLADATVENVTLDTTAQWNFQSNADIHTVELELLVGASESTLDLIARSKKDGLAKQSLTGERELSGSLMSASDFDIADFQPSSGRLSRTVIAALRFYALRDGEVVADAEQVTTFDVTVTNKELSVEVSLGGSGEVGFQTTTG